MLRQTLAILMALFVGFASFVWIASFSSSFQSCISQEGGGNTAENGESQNHAIVVVSSRLRCAARFTDGHNGVITAIATVLLTFVTGGLVLTGYRQIQTSRAQLRAYVFIDGGSLVVIKTDKNRFFIKGHIALKNFGQTPGYQFTTVTRLDVFGSGRPRHIELDADGSQSIIGPGAVANIDASMGPISVDELEAIRAGQIQISMWGKVQYVDAFDRHKIFEFWEKNGGRQGNADEWALMPDKPYKES